MRCYREPADLDLFKRTERPVIPELEPSFYGFSDADMETVFNVGNTFFGKDTMSLRELLNALRETYCGTIGAEYMYITDQAQKRWWQQKLLYQARHVPAEYCGGRFKITSKSTSCISPAQFKASKA